MSRQSRERIMDWVGSEILPHEGEVRAWLRRTLDPADIEDVVQEAYCQIARLEEVGHIRSGRAYFFTTARNVVLMQLRRARVVRIDSVTEIDNLNIVLDEPSPERVAGGRRELERVRRLIEGLPERCRRIFELRKIEGLPQREVARRLGVTEHVVENDVGRGLKLILQAIAEGERNAEQALTEMARDERARDSTGDL
ncbi:RNA polymerase sigma factor [Altererythrobacter sp. C41]|uniref:RNA polymerase sigma factor n=1 Tax=Altererythrobacter sp. C41 TaxID=2806021 RepID=UPI0030832855